MTRRDELPRWQRKLRQDIGENPARFLDQHIPTVPESPTSFFRARVKGIDRLEVIGAWIAAERKLAAEQDRQPRQHVLDVLEERRTFLEEHGERPENLRTEWPHELPERYRPTDRTVPPKECYVVTSDGERVPYEERPTGVSVNRTFDSTSEAVVATDGGGPG